MASKRWLADGVGGVPGEEFGLNGLDLRLEFLNLANDGAKLLSGARRPP